MLGLAQMAFRLAWKRSGGTDGPKDWAFSSGEVSPSVPAIFIYSQRLVHDFNLQGGVSDHYHIIIQRLSHGERP